MPNRYDAQEERVLEVLDELLLFLGYVDRRPLTLPQKIDLLAYAARLKRKQLLQEEAADKVAIAELREAEPAFAERVFGGDDA